MNKKKVTKGFTIIELLITITILSIVLSLVYGIFMSVYRNYIKTDAENQAMNDVRITMMNMEREIREAKEIKVALDGEKIKISATPGTDDVYYRVMNQRLEKSDDDINWDIVIPLVQKITPQNYFKIHTNGRNVLIRIRAFDERNTISNGIEIYNNFVPRNKGVDYGDL